MKHGSSELLENVNFAEVRALYKSMGFSQDELRGPVIGIANAWSELVPGHYNLRQVAEFVKKGIYRAGGTVLRIAPVTAAASALPNKKTPEGWLGVYAKLASSASDGAVMKI